MRKRDFLCREVFVCLSVIVFASLLFFVPSKEVTASPKDKAIKTRFVFSDLTALDKETGYMWTRDANIAKKEMNWNDALELIGKLNKQKYAGYNDWRLPSEEEIETLVDFVKGRRKNITESLYEYFNEIVGFKNIQSYCYWSSTTYAPDPGPVWLGNIDQSCRNTMISFNRTGSYYVWPVRSEKRFVFSGLTALDKETGYMWTRDANIAKKGMNWNDALELIGKLNKQKYAGYNDWRLPSEEEIETLVDFAEGRKKGHINIRHTKSLYEYFNEIGFKNVLFFYYWSSTTSAYDTTFAWVVSVDGHVLYGNKTNNYCRVWPVRSGQ